MEREGHTGLLLPFKTLVKRTEHSRWGYLTARKHGGGSYDPSDLSQPCYTPSYTSDFADRLMGWVNGPWKFPEHWSFRRRNILRCWVPEGEILVDPSGA